MTINNKKETTIAFILVTSLFFLWGFVHNLDPILIPHLKKSFTLTNTQATLVDSAVYIAYFVMALPAGFIIKKLGYKYAIIIGLLTFALGSFLFLPAADNQSYTFFLAALFVIACGLTVLETAANPYASALGPEETSTRRLNLAQSFNGLAAALAPIIGSRLILTKGHSDIELAAMNQVEKASALAMEAQSVKTPYMILGLVLLVVAIAFAFAKLPKLNFDETGKNVHGIKRVLQYKHLMSGILAQFFFVGAQVSVFSLFILYATKAANINQLVAANYLSFCGIAFLVGRFFGTFLMKYFPPNRLLGIYAVVNIFLSIFAMYASGLMAIYTIILICFFMSIMFPTIFDLSIKNLGNYTEYGSSLLIMAIVGGALFPPIFGYIGDITGNIQLGYVVPAICFIFISYFGFRSYKVQQKV
jgi:FHS family L-fucose permease-like MFS transporter